MTRAADPSEVEALLLSERTWCAYALADLEEPLWSKSAFHVAADSALLVVQLARFNVLFGVGSPRRLEELLAAVDLPDHANLVMREPLVPPFATRYSWDRHDAMLRQSVTARTFSEPDLAPPPGLAFSRIADADALSAFYGGDAGGFDPSQVGGGVFFAASDASGIVAAAGTHVISRRHGIAALGNVLTREHQRGRGVARRLSALVVRELFRQGCTEVVLNVRADNAPALAAYSALGFETACRFVEVYDARRMSG